MHNDIATAAIMESRIVEEEDVEVRPEEVPTACSPGAVATSIVFSTLDLANYIQFILYFIHLLCNAHYA